MRVMLLFLTILIMPLTSVALDFQHRDTVLLTDINGITSGRLGRAVGINQGSVFMGAPEQDLTAGATYLYRINEQREMAFVKELESQGPSPRRYGGSIVTDSDIAAIGYESGDLIEIYVRNGINWDLSKVIESPLINGITVRGFGQLIDLKDDFLVVGDPTAKVGDISNAGVVMIFGRNKGGADNWGLVTHFVDTTPPEDPKFPTSVAISTDLMVAGDAQSDRALLYRREGDNWTFDRNLQPQAMEADDRFGVSVEAEGDYIAVGALNGNEAELPTNSGSVHIFYRNQGGSNNFGQVTQVYPNAPEFIDRFGESIRLREGLLVVGAPGAQKVSVFARYTGVWLEKQLLQPPEGLDYFHAEFGLDVDYHQGSLVVGSDRWPDISGERYGAVFLYEDLGTVLCDELTGIFCDSFEDN